MYLAAAEEIVAVVAEEGNVKYAYQYLLISQARFKGR